MPRGPTLIVGSFTLNNAQNRTKNSDSTLQTAQGTTIRPIVRAGPARYRMKVGAGIA